MAVRSAPGGALPDDEQPASDFHRVQRRVAVLSIGERRRQALWRAAGGRVMTLFASFALLTLFYASHSYGSPARAMVVTSIADPGTIEPMPFEKAGESFPGSAYYYLASDTAPSGAIQPAGGATPLDAAAHWDDADPAPQAIAGPAARAIAIASPVDRDRALTCLTTAIYYEAATEPDAGQRAVAQVVLNRVAHPSFPKTVCDVVYQGSERVTGCQFTFTCDGSLARRPDRLFWARAEAVARDALAGYVYAPIGLATHYHTFAVHPAWDDKLDFVGQIGAHRFYRMVGPAGSPQAFHLAYAGGEPAPGPHPRSAIALPNAAADPLVIEHAFEAGLVSAKETTGELGAQAVPQPAPAYTDYVLRNGGDAAYRASNLPGSQQGNESALPAYQVSGRWISEPQ